MMNEIKKELRKLADPEKAKLLQGFFKTGPGEYGEGDVFLGIVMPKQREVVKKYKDASFEDVRALLDSEIHEHRMVGLLILVQKYPKDKKRIYDFYMKNRKRINNWDLVDVTTPNIVGDYLLDKDRRVLYELAKSKNIWERRISVLATFMFIKNNDYDDSLKIAELLLEDKHDLIHKAVGWMLREIGKRDQRVEERFLKKYHKKMPRTMLRYAIERFDERKRKYYMKK